MLPLSTPPRRDPGGVDVTLIKDKSHPYCRYLKKTKWTGYWKPHTEMLLRHIQDQLIKVQTIRSSFQDYVERGVVQVGQVQAR